MGGSKKHRGWMASDLHTTTGSLQPIARILWCQHVSTKVSQKNIPPIHLTHLRVDFGLTLLLDLLHDFDVDGRLRWHGKVMEKSVICFYKFKKIPSSEACEACEDVALLRSAALRATLFCPECLQPPSWLLRGLHLLLLPGHNLPQVFGSL